MRKGLVLGFVAAALWLAAGCESSDGGGGGDTGNPPEEVAGGDTDVGGGETVEPSCGNGAKEQGEACDGADLGGATCASAGFDGGTLACAADCTLDTSACTGTPETCGNATIDAGEDCDGADLAAATCESLGFDGGTLSCAADCSFDTSACTDEPAECGNGVVDAGEACDGADLGDATCETQGFDGGTLGCAADCTFDTSACEGEDPCAAACATLADCLTGDGCPTAAVDAFLAPEGCPASCAADPGMVTNVAGMGCETALPIVYATSADLDAACHAQPGECGNGVLETGEACDGDELGDATCITEGFDSGDLACAADCTFDTSACEGGDPCAAACATLAACLTGDGCPAAAVDAFLAPEGCPASCAADPGMVTNVAGMGCETALPIVYATSADLDAACHAQPGECGNGVLEAGEACDGADLGDATCITEGFDGGELACAADCTFDTAACTTEPDDCGNGVVDAGEDCDGADLGDADCTDVGFEGGELACAADCTFDTAACTGTGPECGNAVIEFGEDCDGDNLGFFDCWDFGYEGGTLACAADCTYDMSACEGTPDPCGNGVLDEGEECDGEDLGGKTCADYSFTGGTLGCSMYCEADVSACEGFICEDDEYEENDTLETATALAIGAYEGLRICNGSDEEEDYYAFAIPAAGDVFAVQVAFIHEEMDIDVQLLDAAGAVLDSSAGTRNTEVVSYTFEAAGGAVLRVYPYGGLGATYSILAVLNPACTSDPDCGEGVGQICVGFACVAGCNDQSDCGEGQYCDLDAGQCADGCGDSGDCEPGNICVDHACVPGCESSWDCPEGQICVDDQCIEGCESSWDCPEGNICLDNQCVPGCEYDSDCPEGQICDDAGQCVEPECNNDADCPEGQACVANQCVVPAQGDACGNPFVVTGLPFAATGVDIGIFANNFWFDGESCTGYSNSGADAVYAVTLAAGQNVSITLGSTFDGALYVLGECFGGPLTLGACLAGADEGLANESETISLQPATAGTYYVVVDVWSGGASGTFDLTIAAAAE